MLGAFSLALMAVVLAMTLVTDLQISNLFSLTVKSLLVFQQFQTMWVNE